MKICFPRKITNYTIYCDVLPQLSQYYLKGESDNPILSFVNTEWINYESIPILMGIIDIIYNVKNLPVELNFVYNPYLLNLLDHANFFRYANHYGFIDYNRDIVGGFSTFIEKEYRSVHVMHVYEPILNYESYSEDEQIKFRPVIYEDMRYHIVPTDYGEVLRDIQYIGEREVDNYKVLLAELITNARLYSYSLCYALLHTDKYRTLMSICDVGIGFSTSLEKRRQSEWYPADKQKEFESIKQKYLQICGRYELEDFFDIMEILYYSELQERINLSYLKRLVADNKGVLRIHSRSTQVIFSYKRCQFCRKNIVSCIDCLLKSITSDIYYSPIKVYASKMKGVRIEIEFRR